MSKTVESNRRVKSASTGACKTYLNVMAAVFRYLQGNAISFSEERPFTKSQSPSIAEFSAFLQDRETDIVTALELQTEWNPAFNHLDKRHYNPFAQLTDISDALNLDETYRLLIGIEASGVDHHNTAEGPSDLWHQIAKSSAAASLKSDFVTRFQNTIWLRHKSGCPAVLVRSPLISVQSIRVDTPATETHFDKQRYILSNGRVLQIDAGANLIDWRAKHIEIERHPRHRMPAAPGQQNERMQFLLTRRQQRVEMLKIFDNDAGRIKLQNRFAPLDALLEGNDIAELPTSNEQTPPETNDEVDVCVLSALILAV